MAKTAKSSAPTDSAKVSGYEITARGQYFTKNKDLKMYTVTLFVPKEVEIQVRWGWKWFKSGKSKIRRSIPIYEKVNSRENAQYLMQRLLLPSELPKKYPDALSHKTCIIADVKLATRSASEYSDLTKKDILEMTRGELKQFCALHSLETHLESFSALEDARQAVKDSYDDLLLSGAQAKGPDDDLEPLDDLDSSIDGEPAADEDDLLS